MPRKKQNVGENLQTWVIKDVDFFTRTLVKIYATATNQTTAQALKELVSIAMNEGGAAERLSSLTREAMKQMALDTLLEPAPEIIETQRIPPSSPSRLLDLLRPHEKNDKPEE